MTIRAIKPINTTDLQPCAPTSAMPEIRIVDPRSLFVDGSYQRSVSERGRRQIKKIAENFCWRRFKPPICAFGEVEGSQVLMILDGQHTAIAAASNHYIQHIPVMVVGPAQTAEQAAAFVGQNTERLGVTSLQLFRAAIVAEDEDALTIEQVCQRAGVTILTTPQQMDGMARAKPYQLAHFVALSPDSQRWVQGEYSKCWQALTWHR